MSSYLKTYILNALSLIREIRYSYHMIQHQEESICERKVWEGRWSKHRASQCYVWIERFISQKNIKCLYLVLCYSCTHCYRQCLAFTFDIMLTMCYWLAVCDLGSRDLIVFLCRDYWLEREKLYNFLSKHMKCSSICSWVSDFGKTAFFDGCKDQRQEICYYPQSF